MKGLFSLPDLDALRAEVRHRYNTLYRHDPNYQPSERARALLELLNKKTPLKEQLEKSLNGRFSRFG